MSLQFLSEEARSTYIEQYTIGFDIASIISSEYECPYKEIPGNTSQYNRNTMIKKLGFNYYVMMKKKNIKLMNRYPFGAVHGKNFIPCSFSI